MTVDCQPKPKMRSETTHPGHAPGGGGACWAEFSASRPSFCGECPERSDDKRRIPTNQLSKEELQTIDNMICGESRVSDNLKDIDNYRKEIGGLRKDLSLAEDGLLLHSVADFIQLLLLINVNEMVRRYSEIQKSTSVRKVREQFGGRTFTRDANTPKSILAVGIPTPLVGKLKSHTEIMVKVDRAARRRSQSCSVERHRYGNYLKITRRDSQGNTETLEICFVRPGKCRLTLRNKDGVTCKSAWNDQAEKAGIAFAKGRGVKFKNEEYTEYTIPPLVDPAEHGSFSNATSYSLSA